MALQQLPPMPQPLGIFDTFIARQTETIILKEKVLSLSGDSFDIKLANGTPLLQVKGSVMSLSGRKSVFDMAGGHMFDIQKELLHIHATFACVTPNDQRILEVKSKFALFGSKAIISFTTKAGKQVTLSMKGNWRASRAEIVDESNGMTIAYITRDLKSLENFISHVAMGQQSYTVTIAPGVDMALVAAMCICMDEKNNEGSGGVLSALG